MDIVFVILHYLAIDETKRCVEYINKNIDTDMYQIVIVDNNSANGSGKMLQEYYEQQTKVTVLLNEENLGFARGNNVGFLYAKKQWNPRYIVLLNNDVYLLEMELVRKLDVEYEKSGFAVSGPLIMTADGKCDINPIRFDGLDDRTFLFREEAILYKHMLENNMVTVYQPDIIVFHEEDAATDQFRKTERQKALFELDNHIKSLNILLDVYNQYENH